jgi:hypothetical protein
MKILFALKIGKRDGGFFFGNQSAVTMLKDVRLTVADFVD